VRSSRLPTDYSETKIGLRLDAAAQAPKPYAIVKYVADRRLAGGNVYGGGKRTSEVLRSRLMPRAKAIKAGYSTFTARAEEGPYGKSALLGQVLPCGRRLLRSPLTDLHGFSAMPASKISEDECCDDGLRPAHFAVACILVGLHFRRVPGTAGADRAQSQSARGRKPRRFLTGVSKILSGRIASVEPCRGFPWWWGPSLVRSDWIRRQSLALAK
jgi:hypothetical protein